MADQASDPGPLHVNPIVVPREYRPGEGRLYFHVVFTFTPLDKPASGQCARLDDPIGKCLLAWPRIVARYFPFRDMGRGGGGVRLRVALDQKPPAEEWAELVREHPRDPDEDSWDDGQAADAWRDLVAPTLQAQNRSDHSLNRSVSGLAQAYLNGKGVRANPESASDLRPGFRLESPDHVQLAETFARADLYSRIVAPAPDGERLAALALVHLHLPPTDDEKAAPELITTAQALLQGHAVSAAAREKLKLRETAASRVLAVLGKKGYDEVSRVHRLLDASRNRRGFRTADTRGPQGQPDSRPATQENPPCFEELVARFKQYPGAMRRLRLVIFCSAEWPKGAAFQGEAVKQGTVAVDVPDGVLHDALFPQTARTRFQLDPGPRTAYFRARPANPDSFLEKAEDEKPGGVNSADVWRRFHVLPPRLYLVTQQDYTQAATRARDGYGPPSRPTRGTRAARAGR
jgi:hypothetical protein